MINTEENVLGTYVTKNIQNSNGGVIKIKKKKRKKKSLLPALHKSKKGGTFVCTPSHPITNFFLSFPLFSISQKGKRDRNMLL